MPVMVDIHVCMYWHLTQKRGLREQGFMV